MINSVLESLISSCSQISFLVELGNTRLWASIVALDRAFGGGTGRKSLFCLISCTIISSRLIDPRAYVPSSKAPKGCKELPECICLNWSCADGRGYEFTAEPLKTRGNILLRRGLHPGRHPQATPTPLSTVMTIKHAPPYPINFG